MNESLGGGCKALKWNTGRVLSEKPLLSNAPTVGC